MALGDWNSAEEPGLERYYLGVIGIQRMSNQRHICNTLSRESMTMGKSTRIIFGEITMAKESKERLQKWEVRRMKNQQESFRKEVVSNSGKNEKKKKVK